MDLPITIWMWLAAAAPLVAVLVLIIGRNWSASSAAAVGYFLAAVLALSLFQASLGNIALQSVKGIWDALFIAYIIAPALLLYEISDEAGAFGAIRRGIEAITPNALLHVLAFGWVFPSFLQSITGFGAPIAVAAPLLVALGVKPIWAVAIPIIGHAWAKTFGTLGVAWDALVGVTENADTTVALVATAIMLAAANLIAGVTIAWLYGRGKGVREAVPALLIVSAIHGLGQLGISLIAPNLANVVPGALALVAIIVLARRVYAEPSEVTDSQVMAEDDQAGVAVGDQGPASAANGGPKEEPSQQMPLWLAFGPYLLLTLLIMAVELIPAIGNPLASLSFGLPFPAFTTGYGVVTETTEGYSRFSPLTHPGTFLLVSSAIAFWVFRSRGDIPSGRIDEIAVDTVKTSIPTIMAVMAFIPLALLMEGSGMVLELAAGLARVASAPIYALLSPLIGAFGGFLTGSNLSANILFGPLQEQAAAALALNPGIILAAQTAGAAIGSAIAISAVLLGLGAVGASGETANTIRKMMPYVAVTLIAIALITLAGTRIFPLDAGATGPGG